MRISTQCRECGFPFRDRITWGRHGWIGREALERNLSATHGNFVPAIKPWLQEGALHPVARHAGRRWTAREVGRIYMRELFAEALRITGERIREMKRGKAQRGQHAGGPPSYGFTSQSRIKAELVGFCIRVSTMGLSFNPPLR